MNDADEERLEWCARYLADVRKHRSTLILVGHSGGEDRGE